MMKYHSMPLWATMKRLPFAILWRTAQRLILVAVGAVVAAFGYSLFQVPLNLAAGGISGIGIIVNHFTGWPVGGLYLLMNLPLLIIGYRHLGHWRFLLYTVLAVLIFSVATDFFTLGLPGVMAQYPITRDKLLSAIYAGLIGGIGSGLTIRAGGNIGGTAIVGHIIRQKKGFPLGQIYLYINGGIVIVTGLVFGWEIALHGLLIVFLNGIAADFVLEGPSTVRTATIITEYPQAVEQALMNGLHQGVTHWPVTGGYTGETHAMVLCTVYRSQVSDLKHIVALVDPRSFLIIGDAHQALGSSFVRLRP